MLGLTRHGLWEVVIGTVVLAALAAGLAWVHWGLALLVVPVWVWLLAFFRDPYRPTPGSGNDFVSPADGMVSDITDIPHDDRLGGPAVRVGIFLSVFNVHVNRAPCDGRVISVQYQKGAFINALRHHEASEKNESNTAVIGDKRTGEPIAVVRQIVGLIARRIVFPHKAGDELSRGQRVGMIKFGSRTELYVPLRLNPQVMVKVGDKVRGCADIVVKVNASPSTGGT
jgi:phosphatidylserine decarboxylase